MYLELYWVLLCHSIQELCHCLTLWALIHNNIIDSNIIFSNRFSFNLVDKKEKNHNKTCNQELDEVTLCCSSEHHTALVITDASIKNDIATSISHIHSFNQLIIKTVHHAFFVTSTEAKLFAIRCGINQVCTINNVSKIVVITDSIHAAKRIFNCDAHPYQIHSTAILNELQSFFSAHKSNSIKFWECPSKLRWKLHSEVDKDSKSFSISPSYPTKISWDFCKKSDCDELTKLWKMTFQASDRKGNHFLDLLDNDLKAIELSYSKGGPWLQAFGHSNSLCAWAVRAITNHAPIGEYRSCFFPNMDFSCPCNNYPIETRRHILYECQRFNRYWNPRRDMLSHFVMFLTFNLNAFAFINN